MNVYALGGSKNTGYHASLRLLGNGATVTFLVRSPAALQADEAIKPYVESGKARLVKGDGMSFEDVKKGWEEAMAAGAGTIDAVLFTLGGYPNFSITKGLYMTPPDLVTQCFLNLVTSIPESLRAPAAQPKIVLITSAGLTKDGHKKVPTLIKPFYGIALAAPHDDKIGAEAIAAHYVGREWTDPVKPSILPADWTGRDGVMPQGSYKKIAIIRPSLYTDGECVADKPKSSGKPPYRVTTEDITGYTISRRDLAHFISGDLLKNWDQYEGKCVGISY